MAKRIIVLTQSISESQVSFNVLFWFAITSGARTQTAGSVWVPNGTSAGASAAENTAIQNGTVLEEQRSISFPVGQDATTMKALLLQAWTNRNVQINGVGGNQFYGTFNDSIANWGSS